MNSMHPKRPTPVSARASAAMPRRRAARNRRGYALLLVMVIILTSSAFLAVHQRQLNTSLRIEQARIQSEDLRRGPVSVLAVACALLDNGRPPSDFEEYRYNHIVAGTATLYRVTYQYTGTRWTITAEPDATAGALLELPPSF